jgi:hypothetical protein
MTNLGTFCETIKIEDLWMSPSAVVALGHYGEVASLYHFVIFC